MSEKTKEQLEEQIRIEERLKQERDLSDRSYAKKLVEIIVFGMVGIILTSALVALLANVIK